MSNVIVLTKVAWAWFYLLMEKTVSIRYKDLIELSYTQLHDFQGDLKELPEENYEKLKKEIATTGFAFAPHAWQNPSDQQWYLVDGHQRVKTVRRMNEEGWTIPHLKIVPVEASSYEEAKRRVLQGTSQYGHLTENGLKAFITDAKLSIEDVKVSFDFPTIDLPSFVAEHFRLGPGEGEGGEGVGVMGDIFGPDEIVEDAFNYFRLAGFPYKRSELFEMKQELNNLAALDQESCARSTCGYSIADTYNNHRFSASAQGMSSPVESFGDDTRLKKALLMDLNAGSIKKHTIPFINLVNGTQACSNFRPAFAKMLYNQYCPKGGIVFDSSTGYGGRLVGFLASHCSEYIGTDPNKQTYDANMKLAADLGKHKVIKLYNSPIEDLDISSFQGQCDFAFTSPPYFVKEHYSDDDTQSWKRYPEYHAWIDGFLRKMIQKQFDALKPGALCIINIEDVKIKNEVFELVEPSIEIGKSLGFNYLETKDFPLQTRTFMVDGEKVTEEANESVIIFRKP